MAQQIVRVEFSADIDDYHAEQPNPQSVADPGFRYGKELCLRILGLSAGLSPGLSTVLTVLQHRALSVQVAPKK